MGIMDGFAFQSVPEDPAQPMPGSIRYLSEAEVDAELTAMVESGGWQEYVQSRAELERQERGNWERSVCSPRS